MSRRVITISRKKWGKSATKTERIIRDAILKPDAMSGIEEYLQKAKSVTCFDLANRFNIRMSVARKILREKETEGIVVPYIREGGFVVYTTPTELQKREGGAPIMVSDALEEVASSVPKKTVITEEMDSALLAAGAPGAVKPSRLARKRREVGDKKERKDTRPEVVVEPLVAPTPEPEAPVEKPKKKAPAKKKAEKKETPKKKAPAKKKAEEKAAPKKKAPAKNKAEEKAAPKKKAPAKKKAEEKAAPKKKAPAKKKTEEKAAPKRKAPAKKKTEEKAAPKKKAPAKKKADEKKPAKKTTKKKE